ncbi:MAG: T9SS type A sorting domain-containing protein [Bacteroidales bacterium]|nr:T9SS type A sorting domain-containing protein [Bacteroidales bacterium]
MKRVVSILLLSLIILGVRANVTEITYHFQNYQIVKMEAYSVLHFEGTNNISAIGHPTIPYQHCQILLPYGHRADSIEYIAEDVHEFEESIRLYPYQPAINSSSEKRSELLYDHSVYQSSDAYPQKKHGIISTNHINGYSVANIAFTPVSYIPKTGNLSFSQSVSIRVFTSPDPQKVEYLKNYNGSKTTQSKIAAIVDNPEQIEEYPEESRNENDYEILIICPSLFQDSFTDYRNNYFKRGYKSEIITVEYIESSMTGIDLQEKIRNYIIQEYQNYKIDYVLLAGDVEYIPYRGLYCKVESQITVIDNDIPSDLYYSALDGNWNYNNNNLWGEIGEEDLYPEVALGRFPCSNTDELHNMITKSLRYQNTPIVNEIKHVVLAAENMEWEPISWGSDFLELHIGNHQEYEYDTHGFPYPFEIEKLYEVQNSWIGQDLIDQVNMGRSMIYHCGDANADYVLKLNSSEILEENFYGANGFDHSFPVIYAQGGECAAFDINDCIAERMLSIPTFASAFIGNSRFGWYNSGQAEGPSQHLHREFTDALFGSNNTPIGSAFVESKTESAPWINVSDSYEAGAMRYSIYDCNLLGDPAMNIWTSYPMGLIVDYAQVIPVSTEIYNLEVHSINGNTSGLRCAFIQNDTIKGVGITYEYGEATIIFDSPISQVGEAHLSISGSNCYTTAYDITIIPAEGAYVTIVSYMIDDGLGNHNGIINNGESIRMDMEMQNIGVDDAIDVKSVVSTDSPYIVMTDSTTYYDDMDSGESTLILHAVQFDVLDGIPDQYVVNFDVIAYDIGNQAWNSEIHMVADAPHLTTSNDIIIDDFVNGNGNGSIDPGEIVQLKVKLINDGHALAKQINAQLTSENPQISITQSQISLNDLIPSSSLWATFDLIIPFDVVKGELLMFDFNAQSTLYNCNLHFGLNVGQNIEDFESFDFETYAWDFSGYTPWEITDLDVYEGEYSAVSGEIGDDQKSVMQIVLDVVVNDSVEFHKKISTEMSYDYLRFYIDDQKIGEWSGEQDWNKVVYPITIGHRTLKWSYEKDYILSYGQDCAWLDNIIFPTISFGVGVNPIFENKLYMTIFPNPAHDNTCLQIDAPGFESEFSLSIINASGQVMETRQILINKTSSLELDTSSWAKGVYVVKIHNAQNAVQQKILKL